MVKVGDKWLRVVGIGFLWLSSSVTKQLLNGPFSFVLLLQVMLTLASIVLAWEGNRFLILYFRKKFPADGDAWKRIGLVFATGLSYTGILLFGTQLLSAALKGSFSAAWDGLAGRYGPAALALRLFIGPLLLFSLFFLVYEALYYYRKLRESEAEKKRLEKEKLWSQLENLNQQVNPHFLFNTLNALSSVVSENPAEADKLLNETSKVYRYLLDNNKHDLVPVKTELAFIHSFFQLLQLRFGQGIRLTVPAPGHPVEDFLLPPLTLQLLVENAVKHNVHSKDKPLHIEIIFTADNHLLVKNNLQRKAVKPVSHRIGLDNIAAKYRLLQHAGPVVTDDGQIFSVSLSLIHPGVKLDHLRPTLQ